MNSTYYVLFTGKVKYFNSKNKKKKKNKANAKRAFGKRKRASQTQSKLHMTS